MGYHRPTSVDEALAIMKYHSPHVLAGGTDFLVKHNKWRSSQVDLLDLSGIASLKEVALTKGVMEIGAMVTHGELAASPLVRQKTPLLAKAAEGVGAVQIRNQGTLGGNIVTASPAGDTLTALYLLDAELILASHNGVRRVPIAEFIVGPGKHTLNPKELLLRVHVKPMETTERWSYRKVGCRNALAVSVVSAAIKGKVEKGVFKELSIALGSVGPTIVTPQRICKRFLEKELAPKEIGFILQELDEEIAPISDVRATQAYRRLAAKTLIMEGLSVMLKR